nr:hypothetical protein [Bacillus velezensis]
MESTVLSCTGKQPVLLRPGGVTKEQIESAAVRFLVDKGLTEEDEGSYFSGYEIYTLRAFCADGYCRRRRPENSRIWQTYIKAGEKRIGILTTEENRRIVTRLIISRVCGRRADLEQWHPPYTMRSAALMKRKWTMIISESFPRP